MSKEESLNRIRKAYETQRTEDGEYLPYADTIHKMIDDVVEYQLDKMADMELEDFYRYHMQTHYSDFRNAIEFNDSWMAYKENRNGR